MTNLSPIQNRNTLVAHIESGCKNLKDWRIGTEHEKFGFITDTLDPLPYNGKCSVRSVLEAMAARFDWTPVLEEQNLIALTRNGASITLEPGGQLELSGAPMTDIHQTCSEVQQHLHEVRSVADELGTSFLGLGFSPLWALGDTPAMPKIRYRIMQEYMKKTGLLGRQMMFRSATVQTNMDFSSESDMVNKMRIGLALQPLATALFANSPFADGRPNGFLSYRSSIWTHTDPERTGMLPFVFEPGFGFERYVDYALQVPMYFVRRNGKYLNCAGASFNDFLNGKLEILPGEYPNIQDFDDHLSTIFPEIRLKTFIEMRGADSGPWSRLCALPAFWTGLIYDTQAISETLNIIGDWSYAECESMRLSAPVLGLKTPLRGQSLQDVAKQILRIARAGLQRRARSAPGAADESHFLTELEDIAGTGITPAEALLRKYHGEWKQDLRRVFIECAY